MTVIFRLVIAITAILYSTVIHAQSPVKGRVVDAFTKEPISGASVKCMDPNCHAGCITGYAGEFEMSCKECKSISVSFIGYLQKTIIPSGSPLILLTPSSSLLNEVIVTANRGEATKRSMAPVAVSTITSKMIQDSKALSADLLLNKVSGVNMVNLGNEQHQMSIRQPITTKSLFLYLEDGIPVRTTGIFNHNALLEMNMAATKNIEVIKGPSSSLYGSEAIGGVVNFITLTPSATPLLKLSIQGNNLKYRRTELQSSFSKNKWGFALSGYFADKKNGYPEHTDFYKGALTARVDYRFNNHLSISNSATWVKYNSDMSGTIDSTMFASRKIINLHSFTYRSVDALRIRSTISQIWNSDSRTTVSLIYRDNSIGQNPAYRIRDDYKKINGNWAGKKDLAHGEINQNSFNSYSIIAQHKQNLSWKNTSITAGTSIDLSPSAYQSDYIRIKKDTVSRKYTDYVNTDSVLTHYQARVNNHAAFINFELSPAKKWRLVASMRYDHFSYDFDNKLIFSSFSGSADTVNHFRKLSTKVGFTYNFSRSTGLYANYSQGFVPPQLTEMYTGVKVPDLNPAVFSNYEIGGWSAIVPNKLNIDLSIYLLNGHNEVVSVKLEDGSTENRNAGRTSHKGIEFGMNFLPLRDLSFRLGGAYSEHRFVRFVEKGNNYNGKEMNGAPRWVHNAELWYKPSGVKGLRIGAEWQKTGSYFMDPVNSARYEGYDVVHFRAGYYIKGFDIWLNILNATNRYYSNLTTKNGSGQTYQLAEPRSFQAGLSYNLAGIFKK